MATNFLERNRKLQDNTLNKLSSGERINKASDDAASLAISEKMKAFIRSRKTINRNANDGIASLIQISEGGLTIITDLVQRMRELAVQAASDTVANVERGLSNIEFQQLKLEINRLANSLELNGTKLINGTGGVFEVQVGLKNSKEFDRLYYDSARVNATLEGLLSEPSKNTVSRPLVLKIKPVK